MDALNVVVLLGVDSLHYRTSSSMKMTLPSMDIIMSLDRAPFFVQVPSVVGVDVGLVLVLTAVLETLLVGAVFLPLSTPGGGGSGRGARRCLVAVAGGSKRHP